jgi:hypothetical protein
VAKNKHIGSDFEDFLREEGILEEVDARVQKRVIADQLRAAMRSTKTSEVALARRMDTSRTVVRALLDPTSERSATVLTLVKAAEAVGCELQIAFSPRKSTRKARRRAASQRRA